MYLMLCPAALNERALAGLLRHLAAARDLVLACCSDISSAGGNGVGWRGDERREPTRLAFVSGELLGSMPRPTISLIAAVNQQVKAARGDADRCREIKQRT